MDRKLLGQIWPIFSAEAREHLHAIGEGVLDLERRPARADELDAIRRAAHSLKGSAASLGLDDVESVAHAVEDSLSGLDGASVLPRITAVAVLDAIEGIEEALRRVQEGGDGSVPRLDEIRGALPGAGGGGPRAAPGGSPEIAGTLDRIEECLGRARAGDATKELRGEAAAEGAALAARVAADRPDVGALAIRLAETFPAVVEVTVDGARAVAAVAGLVVEIRQTTRTGAGARAGVGGAPAAAATGAGGPPAGREAPRPRSAISEPRPGPGERSIRVLAGTVDSLSRRVELFLPVLSRAGRRGREMVSIESSLREVLAVLERQEPQSRERPGADATAVVEAVRCLAGAARAAGKLGREAVRDAEAQRLTAITIREDLRTLRMIPAAEALEPLRRTARDAAVRLGKEVELTVSARDVKLDRQIADELRDPLMHLVRNAVDHGIEPPAAREAAGKQARGSVAVRVESRGDRMGIVIEDDGAGLDLARLKESAVRRGAVGADVAEKMPPEEAARLVFLPGISTASEVTALSGRGVGLDVVHEAVVRLRGRIDLTFAAGRGTRFDIDLPLTLATTLGVVVRVGRDLAILPSEAVERVLLVRPGSLGTVAGTTTIEVERVHLPFAPLGVLLGLRAADAPAAVPALVLAVGASRGVVAVDEIVGQQEVVVSSLGSRASRVAHLGGAAVLDDGRVAPVLAVGELLRRVRPEAARAAATPARARIIVADDSLTTRTAMKSLLEIAGYEVLPAADGQEALELGRQVGCDLVVTDVQMPRLDGLALTRAVKGDPRLAATPVVLVTSLGSTEDRAAGLSAGADGYLVKREVQSGKLLELVRQLLPARP